MLVHTDQNAGYRCGHIHGFMLTAHIWSHFPWVISLSGADVLLTPPAIVRFATYLTTGSPVTFVTDNFARYHAHVSTCMDAFAFQTAPLLASRAWEHATMHCATSGKILAESALRWMITSHNLSTVRLGGRAGNCASHQLGTGGVWHAGNLTKVVSWLEKAETPLPQAPTPSREGAPVGVSPAPPPAKGVMWASWEMCWAAARVPRGDGKSGTPSFYWASSCSSSNVRSRSRRDTPNEA